MKKKGCNGPVFVCLIAVPEGVSAFQNAPPDIPIITADLDRQLDKNCYILPSLGDVGDRIYNAVSTVLTCLLVLAGMMKRGSIQMTYPNYLAQNYKAEVHQA